MITCMAGRLPRILAGVRTGKQLLARNAQLYDAWSNVHFLTGILFGWILPAFPALLLMVLWEPFEVLLLSPFLMQRGIVFGYEALPNSLSDIVFDAAGVIVGILFAAHFGRPEDILLLFR